MYRVHSSLLWTPRSHTYVAYVASRRARRAQRSASEMQANAGLTTTLAFRYHAMLYMYSRALSYVATGPKYVWSQQQTLL